MAGFRGVVPIVRRGGIEVLVVERSSHLRERIAALASEAPGIAGVTAVGSHDDALVAALLERRDAIVLDIDPEDGTGLRGLELLRAMCPAAKLLVICDDVEPELLASCAALGADGVYQKPQELDGLAADLAALARGAPTTRATTTIS